ncbi:MAG: hypothetical protein LBP19_06220 [Treponema sp.]|nr:hypothetical protein [Treponema sp.]
MAKTVAQKQRNKKRYGASSTYPFSIIIVAGEAVSVFESGTDLIQKLAIVPCRIAIILT